MKLFPPYLHLLIFLLPAALTLVTPVDAEVPRYSKPGCNDSCGNVRIPYPFGIGANCSLNRWYEVVCNFSKPYLSALNSSEILGINLDDQIVTVNTPKISDCTQLPMISMDLGNSPFLFSKSHNQFVVEGCGRAVLTDRGTTLTGCSTNCLNETVTDININCLGVTCCQASIPHYLKSYTVNLTRLESRQDGDGACGSAFLVAKNSSDEGGYRNAFNAFIPVSLLWTLGEQRSCCKYSMKILIEVDMGNGTAINSWRCYDNMPLDGNFYLEDGCTIREECARCEGPCGFNRIYDADGLPKQWNVTCFPEESDFRFLATMIATYIGIGLASLISLIAITYTSYKVIKKAITKRQRKSVFKRINGGLLLKQQEEIDPSLVDKTILFTSRELAKATDNFNENRILGSGGQGTVYKGMLADGRIVAIKKSKLADESQLEEFINEVVILSQVNHRNVVKLLGCCLETEVPLLVSEFISNGTLYDCIHDDSEEFLFSFSMRLQIATEVAQALAYLHSATSIPIYHRDVKTTNILLDNKYRAKVSDFGTSRLVSIDQTHLTTLVKGTLGYLDPEYFQSSKFTEKSDVYSFGVVIVELLTREKPISLTRFGENKSLVAHFILALEEGRAISIFDATMNKESTRDELLELANIAMKCLNPIGKNRPTMKEVATKLEILRASHIPSTVQTNAGEEMQEDEISLSRYSEEIAT